MADTRRAKPKSSLIRRQQVKGGAVTQNSDYVEPCVLNTVIADGVASAFIENGFLRIIFFENQQSPGTIQKQKVAVLRVAISLAAIMESRAIVNEALKAVLTPHRWDVVKDISDLLIN